MAIITCKASKPLDDDFPLNMQVITEQCQSFSTALFIHLNSATTKKSLFGALYIYTKPTCLQFALLRKDHVLLKNACAKFECCN